MSLQSRIAALITAIGADIKALMTSVAAKVSDTPVGSTWVGATDVAPSQNQVFFAIQYPVLAAKYTPNVGVEDGTATSTSQWAVSSFVEFTATAAKTFTFNAGDGFGSYPSLALTGGALHGRNVGAGDLTLVAGEGFTLHAPADGSLVVPQGCEFKVQVIAEDEAVALIFKPPVEATPFVPITQSDYDALSPPDAGTLYVIVDGPAGGAGAAWLEITQSAYDALDPPDSETLYIVID
jgi:hypothetical protein